MSAETPDTRSGGAASRSRDEPRRIVVGSVGDWRTEQAIPAIAELGKRLLAEVELVHNFDPAKRPRYDGSAMSDDPAGHLLDLRRHAESRLGLAAMRLREAGTPAHVRLFDKTSASVAILERVAEVDAELIVLVTDAEESMSDRLLGTVVGEVVSGAACPVLSLTPSQGADGAAWHRIVAPVDFSEASRRALARGLRWAPPNAHVDLLYVVEPGFPVFHGSRGLDGDHFDKQSLEREVRSDIERFWGELETPDFRVEAHLAEGLDTEQTFAAARRLEADLVVVPAEKKTFGRALGERLANRPSECAVLAVPC